MAIQFKADELPKPGIIVSLQREGEELQRFHLARAKPHTNKDGTASAVLKWISDCNDCGERYSFRCGISTRAFTRRCDACRKANPFIATGFPKGPRMRHVLLDPERPLAAIEADKDIDPDSLF